MPAKPPHCDTWWVIACAGAFFIRLFHNYRSPAPEFFRLASWAHKYEPGLCRRAFFKRLQTTGYGEVTMFGKNMDLEKFIAERALVSLPGGFGTTLQLKGYKLHPEAWSGEANLSAPHLLGIVHAAFHEAGADIHTTNTFRTHPYFMARDYARAPEQADRILENCRTQTPVQREFRNVAEELAFWASKRAVDAALAVQAQSDRPVLVGGSFGPIGDTHSHSEDAHRFAELLIHHGAHARLLKELGCDVLFPETIPSLREGVAMAEASAKTGLPFITSFVINPETGALYDGTSIKQAVRETECAGRQAVLFNCTPASAIGRALDELLSHYDGPVGAYPNGGGSPASDKVSWDHDLAPAAIRNYVDLILNWVSKDERVKVLGGCCGASPEYITALNETLRNDSYVAPKHPSQRFFAEAAEGNSLKKNTRTAFRGLNYCH
jgi:homocysteine S-methyltransferase